WKQELPHLSKPATQEGRGGVSWIGQNPDPCRAKYLLKQGVVPLPPAIERTNSQPQVASSSDAAELVRSESTPVLQEKPRRRLAEMSCNKHYIEQRLKLEDEQQLRSGPDMKELIYHGVSYDHQGRRAYLDARRRGLFWYRSCGFAGLGSLWIYESRPSIPTSKRSSKQ
ncbi:Man1b1, partial [Symbiodinium pilosum]